jgi:predicted nucleotidyltransferase
MVATGRGAQWVTPLPEDKLKAIVSLLEPYRPVAVYAFGSRTSGEARPDSDLDLAVLLPPARRLPVTEKLAVVDRLLEVAGVEVDLVVLNEARLPLRFEIIRHGRVIWESSRDARTDAEDVIVRDYLDFRPFLERSFRDIIDDTTPGAGQ